MAKYQILYWHDIPVQVRAGGRHDRVSVALSDRFQEAVDNAAMRAKLTGSDAYTDGYHWGDMRTRDGTAEQTAQTIAAELEAKHQTINWRETADKLLRE